MVPWGPGQDPVSQIQPDYSGLEASAALRHSETGHYAELFRVIHIQWPQSVTRVSEGHEERPSFLPGVAPDLLCLPTQMPSAQGRYIIFIK